MSRCYTAAHHNQTHQRPVVDRCCGPLRARADQRCQRTKSPMYPDCNVGRDKGTADSLQRPATAGPDEIQKDVFRRVQPSNHAKGAHDLAEGSLEFAVLLFANATSSTHRPSSRDLPALTLCGSSRQPGRRLRMRVQTRCGPPELRVSNTSCGSPRPVPPTTRRRATGGCTHCPTRSCAPLGFRTRSSSPRRLCRSCSVQSTMVCCITAGTKADVATILTTVLGRRFVAQNIPFDAAVAAMVGAGASSSLCPMTVSTTLPCAMLQTGGKRCTPM